MKLQVSLVSFFVLSASASVLASTFCGSTNPPEEALEAAQSLGIGKRDISTHSRSSAYRQREKGIVIPTYLHVIESKKKAGTVTDKMINDQVRDNPFLH
jgi:formate-dependent phosphoribosylglycinamide formyltransferase (GAR transformylase)